MIVSLRLLAEIVAQIGATPGCQIDTDEDPLGGGVLSLNGIQQHSVETILVPAAASEQAVTFTDACMVLLIGSGPFDLRRATGETPFTNLRAFLVFADDTDDGVATTSILLDGNGVNQTTISAIIVEKPS